MTERPREDDVLDLLRAANPVPAQTLTDARHDLRARRDLDRILIGDIAVRPTDQFPDLDSAHATAAGDGPDAADAPEVAALRAGASTARKATPAAASPGVWRRPLTRAVVAATAVAAATVIAVTALGPAGPVPVARADTPPALVITAPAPGVDGAQTLRRLADLARRQPAVDPSPCLFTEAITYDVDTAFGDAGTTVEVVPSRSQVWLAPDGQVHREIVSAGGTDAWNSNGVIDPALISPAGATSSDYTAAERDRSTTLASEPAALRAQLNADGPGTDGGLVAGYLSDLFNRFHQGLPTPAQQAATWQVLADTDQLKTLGDTTDRAGRPAIALSYDTTGAAAGRLRYQLLLDPTTGLLLGYEQITLKRSPDWQQQVPAVTGGTTFLRTATAQRLSAVPPQ